MLQFDEKSISCHWTPFFKEKSGKGRHQTFEAKRQERQPSWHKLLSLTLASMASEASSHHSSHVPWISGIGSSTCEEKRENGGVTIVGNTSAKIISASIFLLGILEALEIYIYLLETLVCLQCKVWHWSMYEISFAICRCQMSISL